MRIKFICAAIALSIGVSSAYAGPTLFDWKYYGANNPDVVAVYGNTKEAMLAHYIAYGFAEGRKRDQGDIPWKTRKQNDWDNHISTFH